MKTEKYTHRCLKNIFHQASEDVKSWPKWMRRPEMRNLLTIVKSGFPNQEQFVQEITLK